MPCQDEFGGDLDFEVMLDSNFESYRQKWKVCMFIVIIRIVHSNFYFNFFQYSVTLQKLFIDIDKVLLLNFKCDHEKIIHNNPVFVRALPMYSAADWLREPVNRCLQHLSPIDTFNRGK